MQKKLFLGYHGFFLIKDSIAKNANNSNISKDVLDFVSATKTPPTQTMAIPINFINFLVFDNKETIA